MAKYLCRSCPECNGCLGIVVPEPKVKPPLQAINGRCLKCGYRLAWLMIRGKRSTQFQKGSLWLRFSSAARSSPATRPLRGPGARFPVRCVLAS
jgi:hypothetical protein